MRCGAIRAKTQRLRHKKRLFDPILTHFTILSARTAHEFVFRLEATGGETWTYNERPQLLPVFAPKGRRTIAQGGAGLPGATLGGLLNSNHPAFRVSIAILVKSM
jgi:hypothetical protein